MNERAAGIWEPMRVRLTGARWHSAALIWLAVMTTSLCIVPLLDRGWWLAHTAVVVAVIVVTGGLVRTLRLPAPVQPLAQAVALLGALILLFTEREPGWGWLPGPTEVGQLRDLAAQGREFAEQTVAPAGYDPGLLLIVVAGVGLVALATDTLAAGLDLPGLTLIPLGATYVVPWAINGGWAPWWAFVAVALGWFGILGAAQRDRALLWSVRAQPGSTRGGMAIAAVTTAVALLAGGLASLGGPAVPITLGRGMGAGSGAVEIDALVSLRRSLVNNDDRVILTYSTSAPRPDYLRMAVLEEFDGTVWSTGSSESGAALGPQPPARPDGSFAGSGTPLAEYQMDIGPLSGTVVPSPAWSVAAPNEWPSAWEQRSALLVRTDGRTIEGTRATIVAEPSGLDALGLRGASTQSAQPGLEPDGRTTQDPAPLVGDELGRLADEVTEGAATPFDRAVALQRWFTVDGGFRYSTDIEGGSDEDALASFLDERVGYCEQFAASMALMARSVGIPSRVVVGFTQGRLEDGQWVVRGTDAHAWPELWMGTAGWVRFEPTPGAPSTTVPTYTRDTSTDGPTEQPTAAPSDPGASAGADPRRPDAAEDPVASEGQDQQGGLPWWIPAVLLVGLALLLLPGLARLLVRRRRGGRGSPEDAYREVADTMVDLGLGGLEATPRATLMHIRHALSTSTDPVDDRAIASAERILRAVEWQRYGAGAAEPIPVPGPSGGPAGGPKDSRAAGAGLVSTAVGVMDPVGAPSTVSAPAVRPGALNDDVRVVRKALATRVSRGRRMRAAVLPASIQASFAERLAGSPSSGDRP